MLLFYDTKNNIIKDKEQFDKETIRNIKAYISIVSLEKQIFKISLTFGIDNKKFWEKDINISDIQKGKKTNILIRNDALYWEGSPETNPYIVFREDDDFIYFIETCSDYLDVNFCPRIQLYRTQDEQFLIKINLLTLYDTSIDPIITTKTFHEIIHEYDKTYLPEIRKYRKKLRENTEPRVSLSYMEAQLDIICQLMFLLLEQNKEFYNKAIELIPNLNDFKNTLNNTYITNIKSLQDCLNEIAINKTKIRNIQKEYYEYKNYDKTKSNT